MQCDLDVSPTIGRGRDLDQSLAWAVGHANRGIGPEQIWEVVKRGLLWLDGAAGISECWSPICLINMSIFNSDRKSGSYKSLLTSQKHIWLTGPSECVTTSHDHDDRPNYSVIMCVIDIIRIYFLMLLEY